MSTARLGYSEFKQGWPVVFASLVGIGLGLSPVPFYTIGMLAPELAKQFHWQFAQIMAGITIMTATVLVSAPIAGLLADRFGVRRVVLTSIVLFGVSFSAFAATAGSLPLFYATWAAVAMGGSGTLPITWTRAVNNWFDARKGLALGISLLGTGLFGFLIKPVCAWLIAHVGWRFTYLAIGAMPLGLALPIAWVFFHDTVDAGASSTAASGDGVAAPAAGFSFREALRDWRFWLLAFAFVPISFALGGPIPNMENILAIHGFDKASVATLVSFIGLSVVAGRIVGGWLIDRIWAPGVAFILLSMPAISCWLLARAAIDYSMALVSIALIGFAAGVEYDLMAFLVARYFGMRAYAAIYGSLYGSFALGAGVGPLVFGAEFDKSHSYGVVLETSAVMLVASALLLLTLGRYRQFRQVPAAGILAAAERTADQLPI
jgi:predicted MFS family arabinose efflux permease